MAFITLFVRLKRYKVFLAITLACLVLWGRLQNRVKNDRNANKVLERSALLFKLFKFNLFCF